MYHNENSSYSDNDLCRRIKNEFEYVKVYGCDIPFEYFLTHFCYEIHKLKLTYIFQRRENMLPIENHLNIINSSFTYRKIIIQIHYC